MSEYLKFTSYISLMLVIPYFNHVKGQEIYISQLLIATLAK